METKVTLVLRKSNTGWMEGTRRNREWNDGQSCSTDRRKHAEKI